MSSARNNRANELLADRAIQGLSAEEVDELELLLGGASDDTFDEAATAALLATISADEPLPARLAAKVEADALQAVQPAPRSISFLRSASTPARRGRDPFAYAGWVVAAACLALAVASFLRPVPPSQSATNVPVRPVPPEIALPPPVATAPPARAVASKSAEREELLTDKGTVRIDWAATKDPLARGVSGDVVWNEEKQRGYMRFHGLATNDPKKTQYQLWIFDPSQSAKTPIDGGVFDIDSESGDVVVAITPKLGVTKPSLFAVTVEKPGGVVVSKREHIVVVAPVRV